jgi:hypothetical protein
MMQRTHRSNPARSRKRPTRSIDGRRSLRILTIAATMVAATGATYGSDLHESTELGTAEASPGNRLGSAPVNDDCINAINLNEPQPGGNDCTGGFPCTITIDTELATLDGDAETWCALDGMPDRCNWGEPMGTTDVGSDIWYT